MFNNIKWWARPYSACVSGRSVSLLVMCPWFNISFIGVNVRSACIYLFSTTAYVNGPVRSYIWIPHPDMRNDTHHARALPTPSSFCWGAH